MSSYRLERELKTLSEYVKQLPPTYRRELAILAASKALKVKDFSHEIIDECMSNDLSKPIDEETRSRVLELVEELDLRYFELKETSGGGGRSSENWEDAFEKARAVNALYFALSSDPSEAIHESLYEAHHASVPISDLVEMIIKIESDKSAA
jgi:hypothetical protein